MNFYPSCNHDNKTINYPDYYFYCNKTKKIFLLSEDKPILDKLDKIMNQERVSLYIKKN